MLSADSSMNHGIAIGRSTSCDDGLGHGQAGISIGAYAATVDRGVAIGAGNEIEGADSQAYAEDHCIALGRKQRATNSGLMVGMESDYHMFSGHWHNASVDGNLAILNDSLSVSGDGSVKVNNQYTFPTGVTTVNDYVLTAQTDGSTAWASGAGGGATSPATPLSGVQFNDNGSFGAESNFTFSKAGSGILKVGTIVTSDTDAARIGVVSIGSGAYCGGDDSVSLGANARSSVGLNKCVSIGSAAVCEDSYGVAIGEGASAHGAMGVAVGYGPRANAYSVAIGGSANCLSEYSVSIGRLSPINYDYSVGVGALTTSSAAYSTALGYNADAGNYSIALGPSSNANAANSIAIGSSQTTPISGLVIGHGTNNWILSGNFNTSAASTNGNLVAGTKFGINRTSAPDAMLDVTNFAATDVGAIIQGAASQTADLTQWQDSAGVTWASVDPTGRISASGGLVLPDNTPVTTTNTLYNVGGVLNFNGSGVNGAGGAGTTYTAGTGLTLVGSEFNMYGTGALTELSITEALSTATPLTVKGAASQTADLTQWQNSAGTTLASMGMTTSNDRATLMVSGTIVSNVADAARIGVVSIGSGSYTTADNSVAIGDSAYATHFRSVSIGTAASARNTYAVAMGYDADASQTMSTAIGAWAEAVSYSTSIGCAALAPGSNAVAIGYLAEVATRSVAIGNAAVADESYSVGVGQGTSTAGQYAVSLGSSAGAGYYSIGLGAGSNANAAQSIAIGQGTLTRVSGLVIGMGVGNSILSGQFNSSTSHTDGFLNVLDNKLQVSGDGSVKVNNQYTFPTGVTASNDYVLTAQTDGSTAWAAAAGGSGGGISWDGSTANGIATYKNASEATVESNLTFDGNTLTVGTGGIVVPDHTPGTTTNTLYNVGGVLNFNGSGVNGAGGAGTTYTAGTGLTLVGSEFNMYGTGALTELSITEALSTATPLTVKGAASQSADLTQWQNSAGTTLASIAPVTANDAVTMLVSGNIVSNVADAGRVGVISIGSGAFCTNGNHGIAIGTIAETQDYDVAIGYGARAVGGDHGAVAIGKSSFAYGKRTVAIGQSANANANRCTAIGEDAFAGVYGSVAMGFSSDAGGNSSISIGADSDVGTSADNSIAIGTSAAVSASCAKAIALGWDAKSRGATAIALGWQTNAPASGLVVGAGVGNSIVSGQFNSSTSYTDGFLNVLDKQAASFWRWQCQGKLSVHLPNCCCDS